MCDEYDDARVKALWRALAEAHEKRLEAEEAKPILVPIAVGPPESAKLKPKALLR